MFVLDTVILRKWCKLTTWGYVKAGHLWSFSHQKVVLFGLWKDIEMDAPVILSCPVLFQPGTWFPAENWVPGAILEIPRTASFESVHL